MHVHRLFDFITMSFILYPMRFVNFLQYVCYYIWLKHEMDQECGTCLWVWNFHIDCFLIYVNVHHDFIYMWHCLSSVDHQIWFYLAIYEWLTRLQWLIFAINFFHNKTKGKKYERSGLQWEIFRIMWFLWTWEYFL